MQKINRNSYEGKNWLEKEVYRQFLASKIKFEKTEPDPVDPKRTNESAFNFEDDEKDLPTSKKSIRLKIIDFFSNNWTVTIIGGIIVVMVTTTAFAYISIAVQQGIQSKEIDNIEANYKEMENKNSQTQNTINTIKEDFFVFKIGAQKDIDYIKKD
jgi:hypothetical protein